MANGYVGQIDIGENSYLIGSTLLAECTDTANDAAKVATLQSGAVYTPAQGITVHVLFTHGNNKTENLTLQIGNSTALPIINPNGAVTWAAGSIISFTNDGQHWVINSAQIDTSTIQIDLSQIENLSLGNITSAGKIGNVANLALYTTTDGVIDVTNLTTNDPTASGNGLTFIDTIEQDSKGKITATKKTVQAADRGIAGVISLPSQNTENNRYLREDGSWVAPPNDRGVTSITPGAGLINGATGSSKEAISTTGTISIQTGGVTNDMLAGNIGNSKLANYQMTIGNQTVDLGGTFVIDALVTDLGLSSALKYKGQVNSLPTVTTAFADAAAYPNGTVLSIAQGQTNGGKEYAFVRGDTENNSKWVELGDESSYKIKQSIVNSPTASNDLATAFIDTISQDINGVITATKKVIPVTSVATLTGAITASDLKAQLNLSNVSDNSYLNSVTGAKGDLIYWSDTNTPARLAAGTTSGYVLTLSDSGLPSWQANAATDQKVKQSPYNDSTNDKTFNLLFKHTDNDTEETDSIYYSIVSSKQLTFNPKSGTLTATKFSGSGAGLTDKSVPLTALSDYTGTGTKFLRQDGWKTASVSITSSNSTTNTVVTNISLNQGVFPTLSGGTATNVEVNGGILTITVGSDASLNAGTLPSLGTISRATLGIKAE